MVMMNEYKGWGRGAVERAGVTSAEAQRWEDKNPGARNLLSA